MPNNLEIKVTGAVFQQLRAVARIKYKYGIPPHDKPHYPVPVTLEVAHLLSLRADMWEWEDCMCYLAHHSIYD